MFQTIKDIFSFKHIRDNLQFYINRIVIGIISLYYLLMIGLEINFDAIGLLEKNFILFIILSVVIFFAFIISKFKPDKKIFVYLQGSFISFCNDLLSIIISTLTIFIPSLVYGMFIENYGMITVGIFFVMLIDMLSGVQSRLDEFNIYEDKPSYEFIIKCK